VCVIFSWKQIVLTKMDKTDTEKVSNGKRSTDKNGKILLKGLGWYLAVLATSVLTCMLLHHE